MLNFILPSEDDCALAPEENLEPNSAGLKSSQTRGVWHKSLEESHSAQIKEKSMLGHLVYSEETTKKFLESDIFRILKSEGITEIGALYKVSPSMFVLVFGSKTTKQKLQGTEIQCRFGDLEVFLNFCKRVGALTNGREPIFVTILFPDFICDQVVDKSNFREVVSALKGRHKFNRSSETGKGMLECSPWEEIQILSRKFLSMEISTEMSRKRWCCATGAKLDSTHAWREWSCSHSHSKRF